MRFIRGDSLKEAIGQFHATFDLRTKTGSAARISQIASTGPTGPRASRDLELRKLLRRFMDVCNAIDYAHSRGVIHRDIKPANIIVGRHGETLVVDWGLAKLIGRVESGADSGERRLMPSSASGSAETIPGSAMGTPAYMSPEQAEGQLDRLGPRSDVYSLGATLYCLLTGQPPFSGEVFEVIRAVQRGEFRTPRQLDPSIDLALEAVCLKAMALKPDDRYSTARALADDVERWIADEPVSARREAASARLARWARRHRTAVAAMGLSLATAVVLLTVSNVLVRHAQQETALALTRVNEEQGRTLEALQRADANSRRARQAVEDYFTAVSQEILLDEPGMQPLREKLLRSALEYHQVFLKERANDPGIEAELAMSHLRYGNIASLTSRYDAALSHLRSGLEKFEELARRHPDHLEYQRKLAVTLVEIGKIYPIQSGDRNEAMRSYRRAILLFEELLRQQPDDAESRRGMARAMISLGMRRSEERDGRDEASRLLLRAREILERLVAEKPDSLTDRYELAELHYQLYGIHIGRRDRQVEALRSSEDALAIYQGLLERVPNSPRYRSKIGSLHNIRGMYFARMDKLQDAIREEGQARRIFLEVVRDNPKVDRYQKDLASSCYKLGSYLLQTGASEQAFGSLAEAREIYDRLPTKSLNSFEISGYLAAVSNLGEVAAHLGRYDDAYSSLTRASELMEESCRREPASIFLLGNLMATTCDISHVLTLMDRHAEAMTAYEKAKALAAQVFQDGDWSHGDLEGSQVMQLSMAYSLRELGRFEEAERAVAGVRGAVTNRSQPLFELARYDARGAIRLTLKSGDSAAVRVLEDEALNDLRRAIKAGFSEPMTLRQDHCFDRLRNRPEFRVLMMDAIFPTEPFAPGNWLPVP
jgi:eukaryotic-like serine/threonine-protein kinase